MPLKVTDKIERRLLKMPEGTTFKYQELGITPEEYPAAAKALERLIKKGTISRASTGLFYKPKKTSFGLLKPNEEELLRPYLFVNNKRIAYITGTALYNRMGLTTQVPKTIKVASLSKRIETKIGNVNVKPVKSYVQVTDDNYYMLELLDVLKDLKKIPDSDKDQVLRFVTKKMKEFSASGIEKLIKIAIKYPPRVRALTGALLNELNPGKPVKELKKGINPLTIYDFGISTKQFSNLQYWNIR